MSAETTVGGPPSPGFNRRLIDEARREARAVSTTLPMPAIIGPYHIREVLGEGGMGLVYLAEQTHPIHRRVALKVIKPGMDSKQVLARFETEREALALMNHPNVARVLDAGATDDGRPYFVMEHVAGISITDYCDKNRLSTEERLKLFMPVCHALQHAHQKGVIHRDIKPSNVLVTLQEGTPTPKVIDFGVAKATQQRLTERTLFTEMGQLIGTPEYMSPEQAEMTGLDIDTRTDIYSLGVVLYQLLVGELPFTRRSLAHAGYAEIQRVIREVEPPKPSTRLSTLKTGPGKSPTSSLDEIAKRRRTEPAALIRELRGDLDWIVMKCLEKDRTRRYETADTLASELQRFLNHEPVLAGPPDAVYRLKKYMRRHRVATTAALGIFSALLAGTIVSTRLYLGAEAAKRDLLQSERYAVAKEQEATARAAESGAMSEFLTGLFNSADPRIARGRELTVVDLLQKAERDMDAGFKGGAMAEARLRSTIGRALWTLGQLSEAETHLRRSIELQKQLRGNHQVELADALLDLAALYEDQGRIPELEGALQEALAIYSQSLGPLSLRAGQARRSLGSALWKRGAYAKAESVWRECLAADRNVKDSNDILPKSLNLVAVAAQTKGNYSEALALEQEALALREARLGDDHPVVGRSLNHLGLIHMESGSLEQAQGYLLKALALHEKVQHKDHPDVADVCDGLAEVHLRMGKLKEARAYVDRALEILRQTPRVDPLAIAYSRLTLAEILLASGDAKRAENELRESVTALGGRLPADDFSIANATSVLGEALAAQGRLAEAQPLLEQGYQVLSGGYAANSIQTQRAKERLEAFHKAHVRDK